MKVFLVILTVFWFLYRLTPLNGIMNGYLYNKFNLDLSYTVFDTNNFSFSALFVDEDNQQTQVKVDWYRNRHGESTFDVVEEPALEKQIDRYYTYMFLQQNLVTIIPAIVFIGISIVL